MRCSSSSGCDINISKMPHLLRQISSHTDYKRLMNSRAKPGQAYIPTDVEHIANVISHGLGIVPSVLGLLWMVYLSTTQVQLIIAVVYGSALAILFSVSTTFHTVSFCATKFNSSIKNFFHIGDRAVIYVFIAASYTPWLALKDLGWWGHHLILLIWSLAAFGITYQYIYHEQYKWLEIVFYMGIGILPASAVFLMEECSGIYELLIGGSMYVCGVVFFKSDGVIPFAHAIWHCFVFVGALLHFYAVCTYLLGAGAIHAGGQNTTPHDEL
ncbi:monocyte to macrophage differentiation factor 2-like [Haliotis rufescens]|uniref:monocyte to macrophage differentiation factor 2-like n=1 Tax=Haliotis rufescens TaxID=6454 RepID=UPI001EB06955|nr:monocyte to macrophage differentiation factor 2-like [Haliotis rufescens]